MAIYSSVAPPSQPPPLATTISTPSSLPIQPIDVESWSATSALQTLTISPSARGTGVTLSIPLDEVVEARAKKIAKDGKGDGTTKMRKDSMKRREALLKGKEGSRRRQRWENDHLLNNPHIQPPLPSDWAPSATHRVTHVPYYLAPLWDAGIAHRASERATLHSASAAHAKRAGIVEEKGRVPADLKNKLKKAKGAKTLLQELEGEIRAFVREYERAERLREARLSGNVKEDEEALLDSEDEEIVFIGRDTDGHGITMSDEVKDVVEEELRREKIVYEGLEGCREGGFARWLVHSLAGYYGLCSWSETREGEGKLGAGGVGRKRVAYVGVKGVKGSLGLGGEDALPRPLWGMV
ncbi:R3H-associated N-terminal domain-containing protein [Rhexocercosporidium sp. MPI-PUGE-AT-0058]|nr:R3H-associated N-terminal domain-containing protein [Rhexocercosporidium sp. MPI-PUGE-AT-0058]